MVLNFKVNSSAIHKVSYNAKTKILTLTFTSSDRTYDYGPVPAREVVQLMKAPSIGKHYNRYIRGHYEIEALLKQIILERNNTLWQ